MALKVEAAAMAQGGRIKDPKNLQGWVDNLILLSQMRKDLAEAVSAGDYEKWKTVLANYDLTEGTQVPFWDTLAHGAEGGRVAAQEGGLMNLGGMEKDYRNDGGFVPIGGEEKADDVPARLSRNEFVFTADAVRNAGGGDIDQGAEVMENVMKNLEGKEEVSPKNHKDKEHEICFKFQND